MEPVGCPSLSVTMSKLCQSSLLTNKTRDKTLDKTSLHGMAVALGPRAPVGTGNESALPFFFPQHLRAADRF